MVTWPLFGTLHGPISAKCLVTDYSKRHTFRVSALYRYHWFMVKLFPVDCAQSKVGYRKTRKMLFLDLAPPMLQNSRIFHDSTRPHWPHMYMTVCRRNRGDPSSLYNIGLRVRYKYYKSHSGLAWSRPRGDRGLSRPTSVFLTTIGVCKILSRSMRFGSTRGQWLKWAREQGAQPPAPKWAPCNSMSPPDWIYSVILCPKTPN